MHPRRGEPEDHVARRDLVAGKLLAALDRADAEAREVVVAVGVHARHLGGLAADQRAAGLQAPLRDRGDDAHRDIAVELAGREIVEEEQRLGALHDQVVGAHRDEVDADAVMPPAVDRQL